MLDLILGTPRHQKECKSLSFFAYFTFAKRVYFGVFVEDPLKPRKAYIASQSRRIAKNEDFHVFQSNFKRNNAKYIASQSRRVKKTENALKN